MLKSKLKIKSKPTLAPMTSFESQSRLLIRQMTALGFLIMLGIALQAAALYWCAIIAPVYDLIRKDRKFTIADLLSSVGAALLILYLSFVFSSIFVFLFTDPGIFGAENWQDLHFQTNKLFSSHFNSGTALCGLAALAIAAYFKHKTPSENAYDLKLPKLNPERGIFSGFFKGMFVASIFILIYALIQHFSGFDYRAENFLMPSSSLMSEGRYRASVFFDHPLTLASISLALIAFSLTVLREQLNSKDSSTGVANWQIIVFACSHFILIALSGSRFALIIAVVMPFIIFAKFALRSKKYWIMSLVGMFSVFLFLWLSGLGSRFYELRVTNHQWEQLLGERFEFWRVHWQMFLDRPWTGQGYTQVNQFSRQLYYDKLGLHEFSKKFNAHNIYLETLACSGIIGFSAILFAASYIFAKLYLAARVSTVTSTMVHALFYAVLANLLNGITQNTFFDSQVFLVYLALLWMILWCIDMARLQQR